MMGLMLGQSVMVTGVTVIVLHAKISPYYNILQNSIRVHLDPRSQHAYTNACHCDNRSHINFGQSTCRARAHSVE